ncbi:MAG: hypothetical protein KGO93_02835 [Cyanobacteria bacterium REEB446]|jgi:hypothetical protein|nr:hypothetical protein [Cyanobacteria bacterium REEB446]
MNTEKLSALEKELSGILFERGVDSKGFANPKVQKVRREQALNHFEDLLVMV